MTLDQLETGLIPKLIKIDVEGYEKKVLKGGRKLLRNNNGHNYILVNIMKCSVN